MQIPAQRSTLPLDELRSSIRGRLITRDDPDYDTARTVVVGDVDRRPDVIVRVANADDVARVIGIARERGVELTVRCGGHSSGGLGVADDAIVIDLRDLTALDIDVDGRTAWAGGGLTAGAYSTGVGAHGLATGFGDTGSVGLGGITLGGGIGYLVRKHGMTIDNLLAAEIVTADGQILEIDAERHPDLFWAIRGGGGNFGVVTRFRYRLVELPQIVGGMVLLPATPETIAGFIEAAEAAPEELSTIANVMPAPPMPLVPAERHGKVSIMALMCYAGDAESGQAAMAPFRALATPIADMLRPMSYPEIYPPEAEDYRPIATLRTMFIDRVDRDVAATILDQIAAGTGQMAVAQLRVLGGAMARVPADATAFAHRSSRIMANLATIFGDAAERPRHETWASGFADAIRQGDQGAYVNFLGVEGEERVKAAYPGATWERLAAIKRRYDPTNLFHHNQNIPPASNGR